MAICIREWLYMGYIFPFNPNIGSGGGGSGGQPVLGPAVNYNSPSGVIALAAPPGFAATTGRINVTLSGNTTWQALTAGADGQVIALSVVAGNFILTLQDGAGFRAPAGGILLSLKTSVFLYYNTAGAIWATLP